MKNEMINLLEKSNRNNKLISVDIYQYVNKLITKAVILTHYENSKMLGFCAFYANDKSLNKSFLSMICVDEAYRGKGIGDGLINYWMAYAKKNAFKYCELEVKKRNRPAINIYIKKGFQKTKDLGDSILMGLEIL